MLDRRCGVLLLAAAVLAGCGSKPSAARVGEADSGRTITLAVDQELIVTLQSNQTTGFSWAFTWTRDGVVAARGNDYVATGPAMPGSGGEEHFRFVGVERGQTTLEFWYRQPWATTVPPAKTVTFAIVVE